MKAQKFLSFFAVITLIAKSVITMPLVMAEETDQVAKIGLVYSNDGTTEGNVWTAPTGGGIESYVNFKTDTTDEALTYAELTSNSTASKNLVADCSYMYAPLGDNKIKFEEDKTIIVDMKLRAFDIDDSSINKRVQIKYNLSEDYKPFTIKYQGPQDRAATGTYEPGFNHLALADINYFGMRFSNSATSTPKTTDYKQNHWISTAYKAEQGNQNNKWYRFVMKIDYGMNITYEVYQDGETTPVYSQKGQPHWITNSEYLENIAIMNLFGQSGNVDVDYLNIYNLPKDKADDFERYDCSFDEIKISNVKVDGISVDELDTAAAGTVTFDSNGDVSVYEIYYKKDEQKITLSESDYTLKNNTITFNEKLESCAEYTVILDKGYELYTIVFNSEWEQKIGLIYENDGTSGWEAGSQFTEESTRTKANISYGKDEDGTTYMHLVPSGSMSANTASNATPYAYASLGGNKIKFEDGKVIIVEMKLRTTAAFDRTNESGKSEEIVRTRIDYNMPEKPLTLSDFNFIDTTTGNKKSYIANLRTELLQEYYMQKVRFGTGTWPSGATAAGSIAMGDWYTTVITMNADKKTVHHKVINEEGVVIGDYTGHPQYVAASDYFENIATSIWINNNEYGDVYADVDYVKVYTVPEVAKDSYKDFTTSYDEVEISNIKIDGIAIDEVGEATVGTVTFESTANVGIKEVYYEKDEVKTVVSDYNFANNTLTFTNELENNAEYTVILDCGYMTYPISFTSEYIQPVGLIYSNDGTYGWEEGFDFRNNQNPKTEISYVDGYMHFVPSGNASNLSYLSTPMIFASLGDDKIKFKKDYTIVTEMMVRTNAIDSTSGRTRISYSFPEDSSLSGFSYVNDQSMGTTTQTQTKYQANLCSETLIEFYNSKVRFGVKTYPEGDTAIVNDKWYKIIISIDGDYQANYTVIDPETNENVVTYGGQMQIMRKSGFFENIAIYTWMHGGSLTNAYTDVDYVKVYNMPSDYADEYEMYNGIVSEEAIKGFETNGVITLDFEEPVTDDIIDRIEISNRNNREMTFGTSVSDDGKTLTIRVDNPLDSDRYTVTVNEERYKYDVIDPYIAELTIAGFTTDIPEVYAAEGVKVYKAQYNESGRLTTVESKAVTEEVTNMTLSNESAKIFLWDKNDKPLMTYKDTYTVAFLGGSLTEGGETWRNKVKDILEENMPDKEIITYSAGKGGTASNYGAYRFGADIAPYEPDLLFIDFAVNDEGSFKADETNNKIYMESIVQQCLELKNVPDIVFLYTPRPYNKDTEQYAIWEKGMMWKEEIANHYGIKTIDIYDYMHKDWEINYKSDYPVFTDYLVEELGYRRTDTGIDVHAGYTKYAEAIEKAYRDDYDSCFTTPKNPKIYTANVDIVKADYTYIPVNSDKISYDSGWTLTTKDNPGFTKPYYLTYPYFVNGMLQSVTPNAELIISSDADQIALCFYSSTTGGKYTYYIDGAETGTEVNCLASTEGSPVQCRWIRLPGDGKVHTVKIVTNAETNESSIVRTGDIIEYYAGTNK